MRSRKALIYNDYSIRVDPLWHYILVYEEWPGAVVPLWFRLSSDAHLRRVRRPRCLAEHGSRRVRTDVTSHLNARPANRCHGCGCSLPATEFGAQRCPLVVDPMCRKSGSDDIDAVQRKYHNEQMALNPLAQLVPDRAQSEFGLERPECGFQFSQSPVGTNRILNAPLRVAGAQDIMARSGIVRIIRRIALPGNGPGLAVRGLRDSDVIVVIDQGVPFPHPSWHFYWVHHHNFGHFI